MTVGEYYLQHFEEMPLEIQWHFAQRIKYWYEDTRFDDFLRANEPSHDLRPILNNNDYSRVLRREERASYFEKYQGLFGIEAVLFWTMHLKYAWGADLRKELLELVPLEKLDQLCQNLISDDGAIEALTTYVANVVGLVENLYLDHRKYSSSLAQKSLELPQTSNVIYLYTHIILCWSCFYTKTLSSEETKISHKLLAACEKIIKNDFDNISIDMKVEFLVCCRIAGYDTEIESKIAQECQSILANSPYLIDSRKEASRNTISGAEHRNVLFMLAFPDQWLGKNKGRYYN